MEVRSGMKRTKMLIFGAAGIVATLLAILVYAQADVSSEEMREIEIPFSVDIDPDEIELERGKTLKKMVMIETQLNAEHDLNLEVYPYEEDGAGNVSLDPREKGPDVKLDKIKVKISKDSEKVKDLSPGKAMKDSGASVIITVPSDAAPRTYTYMLDAKSNPNEEGLVVGTAELFTVIIK
jgi:hypothetical protein